MGGARGCCPIWKQLLLLLLLALLLVVVGHHGRWLW
jgi:hypothetical protein